MTADTTLRLEHAMLRFYLDSVVGMPVEPISVSHSVTDNDIETAVSDYEDASYVDTQLDLFQPTDLGSQYYELDVTALVQSDYDADGTDAMSAFRLAMLDHVAVADRQSENYQIFFAGNRAQYPELILDFGLAGDLDHDGILGVLDIDLLTVAVQNGDQDPRSDVDRNGTVDSGDRTVWVHELQQTWFGDANLDSEFNSSDLIAVFQAGQYEDEVSMNSTWATGDWSGDGDFDSGDLVVAFQDGGYGLGTRGTVTAVPEPSCTVLLLLTIFGIARIRPTWQ